MIKYRDHKGSLAESMKTVQEFNTKQDLFEYLKNELIGVGGMITPDHVKIKYYANDKRIGWNNTHIVTIEGFGVVGFTNGDFL